jgi:N-acetylmuramoyl-L-alanine amidase
MAAVFVSAGHSNSDPGAVANGRKEADIAAEFRNLVAYYLMLWGVPHYTDGTGKENWPLKRAAAEAKQYDIAVEFHLNAAAPSASGVETLSAPKDYELGKKICNAVASVMKIKNRGAKPENSGQHKKLAFVQAGGIVVELFFITNTTDLAAYDAKKWLVAKAVATVLKEALNEVA